MRWTRTIVSTSALVLLLAVGYGYLSLPKLEDARPRPSPELQAAARPQSFHRYDRAQFERPDGNPYCRSCHPALPHWRDPTVRSFLNLHQRSMDCGVCHLQGLGVGVRHVRDGEVVTEETLAEGPFGRLYAAAMVDGRWRPVIRPGESAYLRSDGPGCTVCHRRGSTLLAVEGLFDAYRRRLLEDLSVLRFLEEEQR